MKPEDMKNSAKIFELIARNMKDIKEHFSGPSPPEIFVGRVGYPNINMGILAPTTFDSKHSELNSAEDWSKNNLSIANVLRLRGQMIYGRTKGNIKQPSRIKETMNELALTHKKTSTEFFLKKQPVLGKPYSSNITKPLLNPAEVKKVLLEENTKVIKKVDYLVNDTDAKVSDILRELSSVARIEHLQKLLSAGLLGQKKERKMVPTRWSITAIDDSVSKDLLEKIKYYKEIDEIIILEGTYIGNYITYLILPGKFSFEAIECWEDELGGATIASDFEGYKGRKDYASNVTGGYYAMRLPICEYLDNVKRQGVVLAFREITDDYYAPLGVGVVRETGRKATRNQKKIFESKESAVSYIESKLLLSHSALENSWILQNYGKQKELKDFL